MKTKAQSKQEAESVLAKNLMDAIEALLPFWKEHEELFNKIDEAAYGLIKGPEGILTYDDDGIMIFEGFDREGGEKLIQ